MSASIHLSGTARSDPAWTQLYLQMFLTNRLTSGRAGAWLIKNGYQELTDCPLCNGHKFEHADGCAMPTALGAIERTIKSSTVQAVVDSGIRDAATSMSEAQQEQFNEALKRKQ